MGFTVREIISFECEDDGYLEVKFSVEGDEIGSYRIIETEDYLYFAQEDSEDKEEYFEINPYLSEDEEESLENSLFNFLEWKEYEHCEDKVIQFIHDYYTKETLPEIEKN